MRRPLVTLWASCWMVLAGIGPAAATGTELAATQRIVSTEVTESRESATLELVLEGGIERAVRLDRGAVYVDGSRAGAYAPGGELESAWRPLLEALGSRTPDFDAAGTAYRRLVAASLEGAETQAVAAIRRALDGVVWAASAPVARPQIRQEAPKQDTTPTAAPADTPEAAPEPSTRQRRRAPRAGVVIEIESLGDIGDVIEDLGLETSSFLVERLQRLRTPVKVVAFGSRYDVEEGDTVRGSLLLWDMDARIGGVVQGDLVVFSGDARLLPTAVVEGDAIAVDGEIHAGDGTVLGAISEVEGSAVVHDLRVTHRAREAADEVARSATQRFARRFVRNVVSGFQGLFGALGFYIFFGLIGLATVYMMRDKMEVVADTVSASFGRALLVGLAAWAIFPIACLILTVLVLTIPVVPVYVLGMALGSLFGYLAVAYAAGGNILRQPAFARRFGWTSPYARLLVGLALLLSLFALSALMVIGGDILEVVFGLVLAAAILITIAAATAGLGAVILSRFGTRRDFARPASEPPAPKATAGAGAPSGASGSGAGPAGGSSDAR